MNSHKLETPCLVLHEFSSRAQIIISSPVETLAASYFTTPVTTNASPECLEDEVLRSGWIVLAYCWMPNHIHALIRTPEPNLASGMQHWLSGYANCYAKRNRRTGHLYQGRYKAFLVEDAGYYWTLKGHLRCDRCFFPLGHRSVLRRCSPAPQFGHALLHLPASRKIVLLGGIGYTSSTAYQALLYRPHPFEIWTYDVAENQWSLVKRYEEGGPTHSSIHAAVAAVDDRDRVLWWGLEKTGARYHVNRSTWLCPIDVTDIDEAGTAKYGVKPGTVTHRAGPFEPAWYPQDVPPPDPDAQRTFYQSIPTNRWAPVEAPKWPQNRQGGGWSTVAYDTDRQQILHLGGGHSSYFGNDVAHFDTTTARFTISYRPQFAIDFNYDLSGPGPWAFNGGPWGNHNYHACACDPAHKRLVYIRDQYTHIYDPDRRAWVHEQRLDDNPFYGSKYTSYVRGTPHGAVVWALRTGRGSPAGVWKLGSDGWNELNTTGDPLPRPQTDGSTITYDAKRDRLWLMTTRGEKDIEHSGQVWSVDLDSGAVQKMNPTGREAITVDRFARESVYLPKQDMVLIGYHLGRKNRIPFYDVQNNRWLTADLPGADFFIGRGGTGDSVDLGLEYDPARDLVWAVMCKLHGNGAVQGAARRQNPRT